MNRRYRCFRTSPEPGCPPDEATNPATWARQIRATVRFSDELDVAARRSTPRPGRGRSRRQPDRIGDASPQMVERAPRRSAHAPPSAEPKTIATPSCSRSGNCGQRVSTSTGQPLSAGHQPRLVSLPGYPFVRQRHWVEHNATNRLGGRCPAATNGMATASSPAVIRRCPCGHQRQVADGNDVAAHLGAVSRRLDSIDRNANFFELGGDSLIAISVAMTAANEGLDLTPQDLYENQTVAALAKALAARYAAGGLARLSPEDVAHPPVPPNIAHFLEHGLREAGRWRIPLILQLRPDVRGGGRPGGAHRRDQPSRCAAACGLWSGRERGSSTSVTRRNSPNWPHGRFPTVSRPEARRSGKR